MTTPSQREQIRQRNFAYAKKAAAVGATNLAVHSIMTTGTDEINAANISKAVRSAAAELATEFAICEFAPEQERKTWPVPLTSALTYILLNRVLGGGKPYYVKEFFEQLVISGVWQEGLRS